MASLCCDSNGLKRILVVLPDGKREAIRLGRMTVEDAKRTRDMIERLLSAKIGKRAPDPFVSEWLADLPDKIHARLVRLGLTQPRLKDLAEQAEGETVRLGAFLESYVASRLPDTKESTRLVYGHTKRCLVAFFGPDREMDSVTRGDAERFRRWLQAPKVEDDPQAGQGLAENTSRRRIGIARQFWNAAIKDELIPAGRNPFMGLKVSLRREENRFHFVTLAEVKKVLAACPDEQWRLMVALARWGGLRVPSEAVELKLSDVNWAENRITIRSPKTAHHDGKGVRVIPLFPELRKPLLEAHEKVPPGEVYFVPRYRGHSANLRTQFVRIIEDAGLKAWPKPWVNMRATRATELSQNYPGHVVAAWLGHSEAVCRKHYLTVTDDDYVRALGQEDISKVPSDADSESSRVRACEADKAAQKAAQYTGKPDGTEGNQDLAECVSGTGNADYHEIPHGSKGGTGRYWT